MDEDVIGIIENYHLCKKIKAFRAKLYTCISTLQKMYIYIVLFRLSKSYLLNYELGLQQR